ncbi:phage tail protein [Neisseria elongata]|uniref:phage tail protein n=1 Tax=Neisseria elongata TaxID=495 RepID=UPI0024B22C50|nr:phage tail protein [Neisseria elongata]
MYLIFNKNGHWETTIPERPQSVAEGYFMLEGESLKQTYAYSDGRQIWQTDIAPPSQYHRLEDGQWILPKDRQPHLLADAKAAKLHRLNEAAQAFIHNAAGLDNVPDFEFASWSIQAAEAKAWAAEPSAPTPVLDQIAASRGIPAATLKAAALRKTLAYERLSAHIAGQRQALQSKIAAAETQTALDAIEITFTAPEAEVD